MLIVWNDMPGLSQMEISNMNPQVPAVMITYTSGQQLMRMFTNNFPVQISMILVESPYEENRRYFRK